MKRLIISNTHYQTIVAIQLKLTLFKNDEVVLLISDHSKQSDMVFNNLKQIDLFSEVHYVISKNLLYTKSKRKEWKDFLDFSFLDTNRYAFYLNEINDCYFDEVICFSFEVDTYGLYFILSMKNKNIKFSMMEEGLFSYDNKIQKSKKIELACKIRAFLGEKNMDKALNNFYCFYPQLYEGTFKAKTIPLINKECECVNILKQVFNFNNENNKYDKKYIYFTGVYDFEGGKSIGEFELVNSIASIIGKDNMLIKVHPRDVRTIYQDNGFCVDKNSSIPWEIIQLSYDFSEKVFLTATSGSVLSGSFMSGVPVRTYYLFGFCDLDENLKARTIVDNIKKLIGNKKMKGILEKVEIPERIEEIR